MCDARYRESLLSLMDARMERRFAHWELERSKRMVHVVVGALWVLAAGSWIVAIVSFG